MHTCTHTVTYILYACAGAIYFSLGNIDPALRSKLDAINLISLFPYELLDEYCFDDILKSLVSDLEKVQQVMTAYNFANLL